MGQTNIATRKSRRVRFFSLWDFEEDDGRWQPIFPQWCAELHIALLAGKQSCQLTAKGGAIYEVDFERSIQTNLSTRKERPVRIRPWAVLEYGIARRWIA